LAYGYYGLIEVDHILVPADQAAFTWPVVGTYDGTGGEPDIRTVANGGHVENTASGGVSGSLTVPADLVFSPNVDGSSPYPHEIVAYNAATGAIIAWVRTPLTAASDEQPYMCFGDAAVTTSQEDLANCWPTDEFWGSCHLQEASGTLYNSVPTGPDLTATNTPTYGQTGKIGNCLLFDDASQEYLSCASAPSTEPVSLSAWVRSDSAALLQTFLLLLDTGAYDALVMQLCGNVGGDPVGAVALLAGGASHAGAYTTNGYTRNVFYHGMGVFTGHAERHAYINAGGEATNTTSIATAAFDVTYIACASPGNQHLSGYVDEIRIQIVARDDDWVTTEYNAQNAPASFYSMGAEQALSAGVIAQLIGVAWASVGQIAGVAEASIAEIAGMAAN